MHSADCAFARCPSVRPCVCPFVTRRYFIETTKHITVGYPYHSNFSTSNVWQYSDEDPLTEASNAGGMKKSRFSAIISLYLGNDIIQSHSYWNTNRKPYPSFRRYYFRVTQISRSRYYSTSNISKMVQDTYNSKPI